MNVLAGAAGLGLVLVPSLLAPSILGIRGRAFMVVAWLVCGAASVVLVFEVLSLFDALTRGGILAGQLVVAVAVLAAWGARGRPWPDLPPPPSRAELLTQARAHPVVAGLIGTVAAALVLQLAMGLAVLPNTWDSMVYHLSRAGYWLQQDSVGWFDGGHLRQLANPPVAEMLQTWTLALTEGDRLASAVQWAAGAGLVAVVFSGARMLGFAIAPSLFAAALFALMPQPLLQSSTTQNDLIMAFFLGAGTLFGARGIRDSDVGDLVIAGAALGLAVGSKGTALAAGPSIALLLGAAIRAYRPPGRVIASGVAALRRGDARVRRLRVRRQLRGERQRVRRLLVPARARPARSRTTSRASPGRSWTRPRCRRARRTWRSASSPGTRSGTSSAPTSSSR